MSYHFNTFALRTLIKQAGEKEDKKKKKKTKKYSTKKFESKVGTNPMTVVFNKRTDGSQRTMNFTRDWDMLNNDPEKYNFKPTKGTGTPTNYSKKNLSLVWDLDKNAYRMVNLDAIQQLKKFM